jgi:hypothetical protein
MPAKPTWLLRVTDIIDQLRAADTLLIDRSAIEKIFQVRRRRAIDLMRHFGGYQVGRTFLIHKIELLRALDAVAAGEEFSHESRRKARVVESLDRARKEIAARRISIPATEGFLDRRIPDLPESIQLEPGRLRIEFRGAEDLLHQLLELSRAIMNDYARFKSLIRDADGQASEASTSS